MQEVSSQSKSGSSERLMWFLGGIYGSATNGTWCIWGVVLLSWIGFFLVLALMFRATGCNRSEAGTQNMDVVAKSVGFESRAKNGPLQRAQQGSLSSRPVTVRF